MASNSPVKDISFSGLYPYAVSIELCSSISLCRCCRSFTRTFFLLVLASAAKASQERVSMFVSLLMLCLVMVLTYLCVGTAILHQGQFNSLSPHWGLSWVKTRFTRRTTLIITGFSILFTFFNVFYSHPKHDLWLNMATCDQRNTLFPKPQCKYCE